MAIKRDVDFTMLSKSKIDKIHDKTMYILENIGMKIHGERALKLLKDAGVRFKDGNIAMITEKHVKRALKTAPKELKLYNRDGVELMKINSENQCYFGTHADQLEYLDPETNLARPFLRADVKTMCKVASALKNIYFVLSVGMTADVAPKVQTQSTFIETLRNFDKVVHFSSNDIQSLQDCVAIAKDFAGGAEKLREKPFLFFLCDPIPPLTHPVESTEKLLICSENGIPVVYMPYCMMGGTSPMTAAGTLAQCNAEALGGLVLSQLCAEGAPFIYGAMPSIFDMRTTIGSYAAPEFHRNIAAMADIAQHYQLPFYGTAGCSDAKTLDLQTASEISCQVLSSMLSKANIIHDVGILDHCINVSPAAVIFTDEVIEAYKTYSAGIDVSDEEFALDVIRDVGHGGHYMETEHTLENFGSIWYPNVFSRKMINPEQSEVMPNIVKRFKEIVQNHEVPECSKERLAILDSWEKKLGIVT